VFPIPDALPTVAAAPLLCAGITVWSPLVHNKVKAGDKVGIIGVGGLGHLALQFAVKLGCHTVGISTSNNKAKEILGYGAQGFLSVADEKEMKAQEGTFDFLLSTISANGIDWDQYLKLLKIDGRMVMVGLPNKITLSPSTLVMNRVSLSGSLLASNEEIHSMLAFCAKHNIVAAIEERDLTPQGANEALAKVEANTVRYRMVLVNRSKIPATSPAAPVDNKST
jgi:D-arabinose 1-dehydrogenase-like Zn-dependent alcohol dehydrogenase